MPSRLCNWCQDYRQNVLLALRLSGWIKSISFELIAKAPERVLETAVKGMLPKNSLGREHDCKLKVYKGAVHPHTAQQPQELKI